MSLSTLELFAELLGQSSLPANHPEFDVQAARISIARNELGEALEEARQIDANGKP
jgi:hypothetical protein